MIYTAYTQLYRLADVPRPDWLMPWLLIAATMMNVGCR